MRGGVEETHTEERKEKRVEEGGGGVTERMCEIERERGRGGREIQRITKDREETETERGTEKRSYNEREGGGGRQTDRQGQSQKDRDR